MQCQGMFRESRSNIKELRINCFNSNSEIGLRAGGGAIAWPYPARLLGTPGCRRGRPHHMFVVRVSGLHKYPTAFSQWQPSAKSANREEIPNTNFGIRFQWIIGSYILIPKRETTCCLRHSELSDTRECQLNHFAELTASTFSMAMAWEDPFW
jgi:hypothetical protein